jgi:hypothetical protein
VAAPLITVGTPVTVAGGGVAPGSSADYRFYGADGDYGGSQPTNLADFSTAYAASFGTFGNGLVVWGDYGQGYGYSSIIAPGGTTPFYTGAVINYVNDPGTLINIVSFTLTNPQLSGFTVDILYGNSNLSGLNDAVIGLSADGATVVTQSVTDVSGSNKFVEFTVTGAQLGDVFNVVAQSNLVNEYPYIGGVTFGALSESETNVPEPASLALVGTGVAGLGAFRCRKRA